MELDRNKSGLKSQIVNAKIKKPDQEVTKLRFDSQKSESTKINPVDVPSIRLSPEQIEEIHADEYSLTLFYATRVEPLTLNQIKREFAEPEPKKAQSVMDRFIKVGLVHITPDGSYYSNYPENYINYSHYRYDGDLEARKDSKVFQLMKEFTGKSEYWKDKTYFSMDAFYSKEQSEELLEMFKALKLKAKDFANENAKKKTIKGLKFRRMKFYDMTFAILLALAVSLGVPNKSYAGGNDPVSSILSTNPMAGLNFLYAARFMGGGNDPTAVMSISQPIMELVSTDEPPKVLNSEGGGGHDPDHQTDTNGGGGHDPAEPPTAVACYLNYEGQVIAITSARTCKLKQLVDFMNACGASTDAKCTNAEKEIDLLIQKIQAESSFE